MLSEEDYNAYSTVGNALALICFDTYELYDLLKKHGQSLEYFQKEKLIDEIIYFRIAFVEEIFDSLIIGQHNKILMSGFANCIRQNFSENNFNRLPYKVVKYQETPINDFLIDVLFRNAGITEKNFEVSDKIAFKIFISSDIKKYQRYADEILKILIAKPNERSKMIKSFNEYLGKDFGAAYGILNDALENKKFDVKNSNSGTIFVFISVILIFFILFALSSDSEDKSQPIPKTETIAPKNEKIEHEQSKSQTTPPNKEKIVPIPKSGVHTSYDYSQKILNNDGLCEFTVDNTRNDMPVYVRIWDMNVRKPVRAFTIAQGEKFTAYNLSPSRYEVRYKELYENDVPSFGSKSEIFLLEQHETFSGTSYSVMELTLYKVVGGNTTTTQINIDEV